MISVTLGWISPYGRNGVKEALGGVSLTLDMTARFFVDTFTHGGNDFGNAWLNFSLRSKWGEGSAWRCLADARHDSAFFG